MKNIKGTSKDANIINNLKEKYKKACDNAKLRVKLEKLEFIKSVGLISQFTRNA